MSAGPRPALWICSTLLLLPRTQAIAQSLRLSLGAGPPGGTAEIEIILHSPRGKEPAAVQWEASIPAGQLNFADTIASAGGAARAAGKSVNCAAKGESDDSRTALCILSGGEQPIQDGVIAVLRLAIHTRTHRGSYRVRIDHGLAVSKDLRQTVLNPVETLVVVRAR